ncbi:MAG TPA: dihydrodipicolinate synthase family protein [Acetobacteraceae bacterium]|jgi:4-hydroxy-tetrahydrodipicolinate synthase
MHEIALQCRVATVFDKSGELDEAGFRAYLQRSIDLNIDLYLASGGSGEGHALRWEELRRVYQIGVAAGRGKVEVNANIPEHHTARAVIEHACLAIEAGVDVVNIYQPAAWHGYQPRGDELAAYYETVLKEVRHPVALAPNPIIGPGPSPSLAADLCRRFPQIVSVNLVGQPEIYFLELQSALTRDVRLFVDTRGIPNTLALGAAGIVGGNLNIMPKTYRAFADRYRDDDIAGMAGLFGQMIRTNEFTRRWANPNSRMIKMFMAVFRLPGWEGGVREPCRMPPAAELAEFRDGLLKLGVPEFDEYAHVSSDTRSSAA